MPDVTPFPLSDTSGRGRFAAARACARRARHLWAGRSKANPARTAILEHRAGLLPFTIMPPAPRGLFVVAAAPPAPPDDADGSDAA